MMTFDRIQPWRRLVNSILLLAAFGIPFLRIDGQSALRFDVPTQRLYFFGTTIWMDEFFLVLIVLLFFSFLLLFVTIVLGRIWCGWLCPQTIVADLTGFVQRLWNRGFAARAMAAAGVLLLSVLLAADILWYFVAPTEFVHGLIRGTMGPVLGWSWGAISLITFLNFLLVRRTFCKTICPYAKMQGALFDERTLVIVPDSERMAECMHCDACVAVCPVGIDVREGLHTECVSCAECVDACFARMQRRGRRSLIRYSFGETPSKKGLIRRNAILSGLLVAVFLVLLVFLLLQRGPLDLDIASDPGSRPVRDSAGAVVNRYLLSLSNRGNEKMTLSLSARGENGDVTVIPDTVVLGPGEHRRVVLVLIAPGKARLRQTDEEAVVTASFAGRERHERESRITMLPPW